MVDSEDFMVKTVTEKILKHATFADAIVESLALVFHSATIPAAEWSKLFSTVYQEGIVYEESDMLSVEKMGLLDLGAVRERDPASNGLVNPMLFFKGFKSIQAHRIAHVLWNMGRKDAARAIQSRCSEVWSVDIHPAAKIGAGLMIDHGTGVVIGETAVIGKNCSFLHGVTLGSTGKDKGDRHPKLGNDILIGCNATILGNICVGSNTKIGSGSIVLKSLPCCVTAVGNPARIVGRSKCSSAANNMDLALHNVQYCLDINGISGAAAAISPRGTSGGAGKKGSRSDPANAADDSPSISLVKQLQTDAGLLFSQVDRSGLGTLSRDETATAMGLRFGLSPPPHVLQGLFARVDTTGMGRIDRVGFDKLSLQLITFEATEPDDEINGLLKEWQAYVDSASSICKYLLARARLEAEGPRGLAALSSRTPSPIPDARPVLRSSSGDDFVSAALSMD